MATGKAAQTRRTIVDAAMRLFNRDGYAGTTMRAIAAEAGVSLGNAYYYFGSKEHLIQAFYDQLQVEHAAAAEDVLARETGFAPRLLGVLQAWLDVAEPHHEFGGEFFRNAADPRSRSRKTPLLRNGDEAAEHVQIEAGRHAHGDKVRLCGEFTQLVSVAAPGTASCPHTTGDHPNGYRKRLRHHRGAAAGDVRIYPRTHAVGPA